MCYVWDAGNIPIPIQSRHIADVSIPDTRSINRSVDRQDLSADMGSWIRIVLCLRQGDYQINQTPLTDG